MLGAVVAQASGNNALAGAAGEAGGELAARALMEALYPGKTPSELNEEQKQYISTLATIAGGLAAGVVGNTGADAVQGAQSAQVAAENNILSNKYGVQKLSPKDRALYEKLKPYIGDIDGLQAEFEKCNGNGECETGIRNKYRQAEAEAGQKLVELYQSGVISRADYEEFVTSYASTMMRGAGEGESNTQRSGLKGNIYDLSAWDWTPAGVAGNPYVSSIRSANQIADWKAQGLGDEKIQELILKDSVLGGLLTPVDLSKIMSVLDNGTSRDEVMRLAAGMIFSKVISQNSGKAGTAINASTGKNAGSQSALNAEKVAAQAEQELLSEINKFTSKTQATRSATMVGAYDPTTGKTAVGNSNAKISAQDLDPRTVEYIEKQLGVKIGEFTSFCPNKAGACAEVSAADQLVRQGSNPSEIKFTDAVRPRDAWNKEKIPSTAIIPPCKNCTVTWPKGKE
nr:VENN motif pre-toxin domain-containing protein [Dickeya oryzae]MCA6993132.1 VENN motif pre-toxin domain-containing protein [Dickeya oryzae]